MRNPRLKTKVKSIDAMKFGVLVEPDYDLRSDQELYAAVKGYGKAVVLTDENGVEEYTPERFELEWRGD